VWREITADAGAMAALLADARDQGSKWIVGTDERSSLREVAL